MPAIRLPADIEKRLDDLARRTGRTKTYYAREAILTHLQDMEDACQTEQIWERVQRGEESAVPLRRLLKRRETQVRRGKGRH
jgi:RHH-type rel operon transcriptional repressor/antitoxin RelB